jgi:sulfur-oxidizing protein SoxX
VKRRRVEAAIGLNRPAVLAEFHHIFSHDILPGLVSGPPGAFFGTFGFFRVRCENRLTPSPRPPAVHIVSPWRLCFDHLYPESDNRHKRAGNALTDTLSSKPALLQALASAVLIGAALASSPASAQSAAEGQKLAFDRGKGNCLTCHEIKGGDLPGTIGPALKDIKTKYPDRNDLVAILTDETKRNPQTVMPPFGRNRILTEKEINAVVDFLQTL